MKIRLLMMIVVSVSVQMAAAGSKEYTVWSDSSVREASSVEGDKLEFFWRLPWSRDGSYVCRGMDFEDCLR